jgi:hypothetical protein
MNNTSPFLSGALAGQWIKDLTDQRFQTGIQPLSKRLLGRRKRTIISKRANRLL